MKYLISILIAFVFPTFAFAASISYTTPGTYSFTVPAGVTQVLITGSGAGGAGGIGWFFYGPTGHGGGGSGGGGGAAVNQYPVSVTPNEVIPVVVGAGGISYKPPCTGFCLLFIGVSTPGSASLFGSYLSLAGGGAGVSGMSSSIPGGAAGGAGGSAGQN